MATGDVTQSAPIGRDAVLLSIGEQTAFWFVIGVMLALGVAMMIIAAWVYRSNDPEPDVLAPLELMDSGAFRDADPESQQRQLDEARPEGAKTLRQVGKISATKPGRSDRSTSRVGGGAGSDEVADDILSGGESALKTKVASDSDDDSDDDGNSRFRKPRRYLAGDGPARRRPGAERYESLDDGYEADPYADDQYEDDLYEDDADDLYEDEDDYRANSDRDDPYRGDRYRGDQGRDDLDDELDDDELDDELDGDHREPDGDTEGESDSGVGHRRSRLPFRVPGAEDDWDADEPDESFDDEPNESFDDEPNESFDDDYSGALAGVSGLDEMVAADDGDTWLDRAGREPSGGRFRRDRSARGGTSRWRRGVGSDGDDAAAPDPDDDSRDHPESYQGETFGSLDDDRLFEPDDYPDNADPEADLYPEEELDDMDFEHDDFDDYGERMARPAGGADPFFAEDFDGEWNESTSPGRPRRRARRAAEVGAPSDVRRPRRVPSAGMSSFDPDAMIDRFRERAAAVRRRPLPPVAGQERQEFIEQAKIDYQDFAMISDAEVSIEDGVLVLRVDLRG